MAETVTCPREFYICCENGNLETCKCVDLNVNVYCGVSVRCKNAGQAPIFTKEGGSMSSNCGLAINNL